MKLFNKLAVNETLSNSLTYTDPQLSIKSKLDAEFRRFRLERSSLEKFEDFYKSVEQFHNLQDVQFVLYHMDPIHGELLPIHNDGDLNRAVTSAGMLLRLLIQKTDGAAVSNN